MAMIASESTRTKKGEVEEKRSHRVVFLIEFNATAADLPPRTSPSHRFELKNRSVFGPVFSTDFGYDFGTILGPFAHPKSQKKRTNFGAVF